MDIRDKVPVIRVAIRGANGRMGLQAIYASMENNEDILRREKLNALTDKDVWIDIVFGAFTSDIPTVQQLLAGVLRSEKDKILEGYDKAGHPIYRAKGEGKFELRTKYVEQKLTEEPQREHVILFTHQEIVDTPEGLPAIKILSADRQNVLSTIRHINVRFGELSAEAIMDRVLDISHDLGANVLLSCVGDTAKQADRMKKWLDEIHEKGYSMGFIESAPAKGWEKRLLSKQDAISVLCTRNFSPTGTLFRTGLALKRPLFEYKKYEFAKASQKFQKIFLRIIKEIIATDDFKPYAKLMEKSPKTIKAVEGETVLVNFPPDFLNVTTPNYIKFSFYEDNEYGFVCGAMIPNLKALGLVYKDKDTVNKIRLKPVKFEAVTNIPGIFGTDWMVKAPAEIVSRGGALSTSSCTTNGNVVGDYIMFMALESYYEFFYPTIKGYFLTGDGEGNLRWLLNGPPGVGTCEPPPYRLLPPVHPVINLEPNYEFHPAYESKRPFSALHVRRAAYWSLLVAPPAGVTYGSNAIWPWATQAEVPMGHTGLGVAPSWHEGLDTPGVRSMTVLRRLFETLPWWALRPAPHLLAEQPGVADATRHIMAAATEDGALTVIYTPTGGTLKLSVPAVSAGEWFNPRTGESHPVGRGTSPRPTDGFATPDERDWVLVLRA